MSYRPMMPPMLAELYKYNVDAPNHAEGVWQPLYDYQTYLAAGQTELNFFVQPRGQGGKTYADTNMDIAGSMASPIIQHVVAIQVCFWPGGLPGTFGAQAAAGKINDMYTVLKSGFLEFEIGSNKTILRDGPLGVFPPDFRFAAHTELADVSTAGAALQSRVDYATAAGRVYEISPVNLTPNQNFVVRLRWPGGAVALPSGVDGRIGVRLPGFQLRRS